MLRTIATTTINRYSQRYPNILLHRIKNQHNVCLATKAGSSCDKVKKPDDNPQNLPRLPVPDLDATLTKYLRSTEPFLNEEQLKNTKEIIYEFRGYGGDGKKIQKHLLERAETHTNWLEQWWLETAYLGYREPVTIYSSPGQSFPFTTFECEEDRLDYTAKLIMAAISYKMLIDKKEIPVDKMGKVELDMKQYEKIIGTCRIPAMPIDKLEYHPNSRHIVVVHNNQFFKINAFTSKNLPEGKQQLVNQLKRILASSDKPGPPVGILTTENRNTWAKVYKQLMKYSTNKETIGEIQKCLFLVCLDKSVPELADNRLTAAMKQFIHGGSSCCNTGNRWYDKTIQFILSPHGEVGLTYEHSPSEGQPVATMVDFLHNFIEEDLGRDIKSSSSPLEPIRLPFDLDDTVMDAIDCAARNINMHASNLELACFKFTKYGKDFIKSQKLSPDSFIQMALQGAFYKIHQKPGAHYESASTRMYVGGRTETIRSCSVESVEFAKALIDPDKQDEEKVKALQKAVKGHKNYTLEAIQGCGVDRHLLGLKLAAQELQMGTPELFNDIAWKRSSYMRISSSQVATKCEGLMGYAPLVKEGYGCCYNPRIDDILFACSAFEDYPNTSAIKFKASLEWCLTEMQNILVRSQKSKM